MPSPDLLRQRIKILQQRLTNPAPAANADGNRVKPRRIPDALLVTNPNDIRYLTGFAGDDSWALIPLSPRRHKVYILSDFRFQQQIEREAPHVAAVIRKQGMIEELVNLANKAHINVIALQPAHVNLAVHKRLIKALGAKRLVPLPDGLLDQRAVKTPDEIKLIRRALTVQQQAYLETLEFMEPGQSEQEVAAYLEYQMRCHGADGVSFPSIIAVNANAALPHAVPGRTKLRQGSMILIDWGAKWDGYCSDLTRVVALGKMKPRIREIYQIVLDAQLAAIEAIRPGARLKDVDAVARQYIEKAGYGDQFGHSLGHGIGLDIHENPVLSSRMDDDALLAPGHVVTVEPGIYLPGVGGVRIEDDVLVTPSGAQVLSNLPKSLKSAII